MRASGSSRAAGEATSPAELSVDALFDAYYARLVRVAWLLLRDTGRAEELVQDAFVDLCRRGPQLGSSSDAGGYLYVAVLNRSRSALRRLRVARTAWEQAASEAEQAGGPESEVSAETTALRGFERRRVLDALAQLPRRQREVLVLRYYAGLSEAEAAEVLTISRGSVKSHTSRGVRALRPLLGEHDES